MDFYSIVNDSTKFKLAFPSLFAAFWFALNCSSLEVEGLLLPYGGQAVRLHWTTPEGGEGGISYIRSCASRSMLYFGVTSRSMLYLEKYSQTSCQFMLASANMYKYIVLSIILPEYTLFISFASSADQLTHQA